MDCKDVKERLDAWVDGVLDDAQQARMEQHLAVCETCAAEAAGLASLIRSLEAMPPVRLPKQLTQRTLQAFRADFKSPGLIEWWLSLGLAMRSACASVVFAGLLVGVGLGSSLLVLRASGPGSGILDAIYYSGGLLP